MMARANDLQERLDAARRWAGDAKFQVSVQQLRGLIDTDTAGRTLTDVADLVIEAMLETVSEDFARRYGVIEDASVAIVGFGKLGSRSIARGSDLDLVMVYDSPTPAAASNGARELPAPTYFARLCQRLVTAIEAQTGEGQLYQVDLRLRPMGEDGPIATTVEALEDYYEKSAWTWERMALTRARVVTGPEPLAERLLAVFRATLIRPVETAAIAHDIVDMRRRIAAEHGTSNPWSIKQVRGGLIDVEFIAQFLQLRAAAATPAVLDTNTARALEKLAEAGQLSAQQARTLIDADRLYQSVQAILRLCLSGPLDEATAPKGLRRVLARAGGVVDFDDLKRKLLDVQTAVRACFAELVEASAAGPSGQDQSGDP
jgi:glutamate-ammonia-ligase adenylyltransferase